MIEAENPHTNLKWPLLGIEEETDSGEQLETPNWPYLTVIEESMGLKETMEGHKLIFRAIAHRGRYSGRGQPERNVSGFGRGRGRFDKSPNVSRPRVASKTVSRDATRCYYCKEPGHISRFCERRMKMMKTD